MTERAEIKNNENKVLLLTMRKTDRFAGIGISFSSIQLAHLFTSVLFGAFLANKNVRPYESEQADS